MGLGKGAVNGGEELPSARKNFPPAAGRGAETRPAARATPRRAGRAGCWRCDRGPGSRSGTGAAVAHLLHAAGGDVAAILLQARGAQAPHAVLVDQALPRQEFFDGKIVALAGFLEREEAGADSGNHLRLAAEHPPLGRGRRQIVKAERDRKRVVSGKGGSVRVRL